MAGSRHQGYIYICGLCGDHLTVYREDRTELLSGLADAMAREDHGWSKSNAHGWICATCKAGAGQERPRRETLQEIVEGSTCYRLERVRCGAECACNGGTGHGPYWYAYYWRNGRTVSKYIGKELKRLTQKQLPGTEDL